ncbi:MAG: hypothetical protein WAS51_14555 [Ilumatobacteraceae bacterium]
MHAPLIEVSRGVNRISLKNSRFHQIVGGQLIHTSNDTSMEVVILKTSSKVGRLYFDKTYDPNAAEKARPRCWSSDGSVPDAGVGAPVHANCAACPMNVKGSASANGAKAKACGYQARMAVVIPTDPELAIYQLDSKGGSLFGPDYPQNGLFNMGGYARMLDEMRVPYSALVTRLSFDMRSATPKLLFAPVRFLEENELAAVAQLASSDDVADIINNIATSVEDDATPAQAPVQQMQPMQPMQQPVQQAPMQQMQPMQQPVQQAPVQQMQPMQPPPLAARQSPTSPSAPSPLAARAAAPITRPSPTAPNAGFGSQPVQAPVQQAPQGAAVDNGLASVMASIRGLTAG